MSAKHWHTLTVRFATDGALSREGVSADPVPPFLLAGIRAVSGAQGVILVDEVWLFPETSSI